MCPESNTGCHLYSATPFSFLSWYLPLTWLQPLFFDYLVFPFSSHCSHNLDHTTLCSTLLLFPSTAKTNPHIGKHSPTCDFLPVLISLIWLQWLASVTCCLYCTARCHSDLKAHIIHFNIFRVFFLNTIFILWNFLTYNVFLFHSIYLPLLESIFSVSSSFLKW